MWVVRCALHTVLGAWSRVDLSIIKVIGVTLNVWKLPLSPLLESLLMLSLMLILRKMRNVLLSRPL